MQQTKAFLARLPGSTHVALEIAARRRGVSMNHYLVRALEAGLRGDIDLHLPVAVVPAPPLRFPREMEAARASYRAWRLDENIKARNRGEEMPYMIASDFPDGEALDWYRAHYPPAASA